jgi:hypothetical protein
MMPSITAALISVLSSSLWHEVAGGAADPALVEKARKLTEEMTRELSAEVLAVSVMKLGRSYFVLPYLKPEGAVNAQQIDSFRHELDTACKKLLGNAKTEVIITAERPYQQ